MENRIVRQLIAERKTIGRSAVEAVQAAAALAHARQVAKDRREALYAACARASDEGNTVTSVADSVGLSRRSVFLGIQPYRQEGRYNPRATVPDEYRCGCEVHIREYDTEEVIRELVVCEDHAKKEYGVGWGAVAVETPLQ